VELLLEMMSDINKLDKHNNSFILCTSPLGGVLDFDFAMG
jgi:hypothetical protein